MADDFQVAYDKSDLRRVTAAFKAMDAEAVAQAKVVSGGLATYVQGKIVQAAGRRQPHAVDPQCRRGHAPSSAHDPVHSHHPGRQA